MKPEHLTENGLFSKASPAYSSAFAKAEANRLALQALTNLAESMASQAFRALTPSPFKWENGKKVWSSNPLRDETGKASALSHLFPEVSASVLSALSLAVAESGKWETLVSSPLRENGLPCTANLFTKKQVREAFKEGNAILARFGKAKPCTWEGNDLPDQTLASQGRDETETAEAFRLEKSAAFFGLVAKVGKHSPKVKAFKAFCLAMQCPETFPKNWRRDCRKWQGLIREGLALQGLNPDRFFPVRSIGKRRTGRTATATV